MRPPRVARVVRLLTALTAVAFLAAAPVQADPTRQDRNEGLRLYQEGKFGAAIPYLSRVLERHRRDIEVRLKRGICYLRTEQPQKALDDFDSVNAYAAWTAEVFSGGFNKKTTDLMFVNPLPMYPDAYGNRGIALLMLGRDQEALESFQRSIWLWNIPGNQPWNVLPGHRGQMFRGAAGAYEGLGQAYHRLGQDAAAFEAYNQAAQIDPSDPNAFAGRADILTSLRRFDAAIADYDRAIQLNPSQSRAHAGRGIVNYLLGRDEAAIADFDRAIAADSNFVKAYSYRGAAHSRRGQNEAALADYNAVVRLMPENAGAYKDRGGVYYRLGRYDSALRDLDEAIRLDPKKSAAYQNRGAVRNALGHYERAIQDLDRAIQLDEKNAGAYSNRGLAHYMLGNYDRAIVDLSEAIALEPKNAVTHFNRAEVFIRLGMRERALEDFTESVRLAPTLAPAYAAIGRIEAQIGRREQALRDFDMALKLDPKRMGLAIYPDRGDLRRQEGDWSGALADYDQAITLQPKRADLYVARGWARLGSGAEWADNDARAYLAIKGWHDGLSPYMAILAALGARGTPRETDARRVLDEAIVNSPRRAWPVPVLHYLRGDIDEPGLFRAAGSLRQQAEAHAFVGLLRLQAGDRDGALAHLRDAKDHGAAGSIAVDVAKAALRRLEPRAEADKPARSAQGAFSGTPGRATRPAAGRQANGEHRTPADLALGRDATAVQLDQPPDQRQADAEPPL